MKSSLLILILVSLLSTCVLTQFPLTFQQTQDMSNPPPPPSPCYPGIGSCGGIISPPQGGGIICHLTSEAGQYLSPTLLAFIASTLTAKKVQNYILVHLCTQVVAGMQYYMLYNTNIGFVYLDIYSVPWAGQNTLKNFTTLVKNITISTDPPAADVFYGL